MIAILLFLAAWRFDPQTPIPLEGNPDAVVAGDVNGDGHADFVVGTGKRRLAVFLGDGKGGFRALPVVGPLPSGIGDPVLVDMNRDGKLDLVYADHDTYRFFVLRGNSDGTFVVNPEALFRAKEGTKPHTHGLAILDLNNDDVLDVVTVNADDADVAVKLGDRSGRFSAASALIPVGKAPHQPAIADFNGDRKPDLLVPNAQSESVSLLLGNGSGFDAARTIPVPGGAPYFAVAGDLNGDGRPDAVVTHAEKSLLSVLWNDGKGGFTISDIRLSNYSWSAAILDTDGDRKLDIVAAARTGIETLLGDGKGAFRSATGSPYPVNAGTWHLVSADFNNDGTPDIVSTNFEANSVTVLLGRR